LKIFLVDLIIQLISFFFFSVVFSVFVFRLWKDEKGTWHRDASLPWYDRWHALTAAQAISCVVGVLTLG